MNINTVTISGNLTKDAEVMQTQGGTPLLRFVVAVNERKRNASGDWEEHPNYVGCIKFGDSCEWWAQRLKKGQHVTVHGRLRYSSWERDGSKRSRLELLIEGIDAYVQGQPKQQQQPAYRAPAPQQDAYPDVYDEDIAF